MGDFEFPIAPVHGAWAHIIGSMNSLPSKVDPLLIVETRVMHCLEIQAALMNVLDVLEVGRIDKAVPLAQQGLEIARALHNDLNSERRQLRKAADSKHGGYDQRSEGK